LSPIVSLAALSTSLSLKAMFVRGWLGSANGYGGVHEARGLHAVAVGVGEAVGVGVGDGVVAERSSRAMVPHAALPLIEPVTEEAEGPM